VVKILILVSMLLAISTPELIRHMWQLKTVIFLHRYLICFVLLMLECIWPFHKLPRKLIVVNAVPGVIFAKHIKTILGSFLRLVGLTTKSLLKKII
jgi:peptidoglycan/LPS O-acetylase OafA/YrhL